MTLGYLHVFDYKPGKADWAANGLPVERTLTAEPWARDVMRRDLSTCKLDERLGDVYQRTTAVGKDVCIVVGDENVVLGRLSRDRWQRDPDACVGDVMEEGSATKRPDTPLKTLVPRMVERKVEHVLITDPEGRLVGILYRADAEQALAEFQGQAHGKPAD
jgi:CBS-domain-containing membrane protein